MVDYSSKLCSAEEEVATYIEGILTEGGHLLWQKYLQRKAFPFAAETGIDALTSQLRMCFVAHDPGESESQKEWELEEEPVPGDIDNWARMHLAVRRLQRREPGDETVLLGRPRTGDGTRRNNIRTRVSDARGRARGQGRSDKSEARSWGVQDEVFTVDEDEEKLREAKAQEEQRKRDKENKLKLAEKQKEDEQRKVQALHEEMARKQHTFDSEGNIIWVEEIKMDRLPKVQEFFPYDIKKDPRSRDRLDETLKAKAAASPTAKKKADKTNARRKARFDRSSKKKEDEDDFPDGFSKLKHGQPPILETMVVKPGVVLDSGGKQKAGPAMSHAGGGMSRKEYVAWTEQEGAKEAAFNQSADSKGEGADGKGDDSPKGPGGPGGPRPPGTAPAAIGGTAEDPAAAGSAPGASNGAAGAAGSQGAPGLGDTLPPIGGRTPKVAGLPGSRPGTSGSRPGSVAGEKVEGVQKAPSAPPIHLRQKKMEAVGHLGRHPRLHIAPLGGPYGFAAAPPPLGATMGHGLLRSGSAKEAYFFPSGNPEMPDLSNMLRSSQSEAHLPKERSYLSATGSREEKSAASRDAMASRESMQRQSSVQSKEDEPLDQKNGVIRPDRKSPAYKGMRHALFPHAGDTGLSQYGAQYT
mmetsp:Transcript_146786/g.273352  ORF Transcript_146786/g.273352 Transcript_146786/m.273352 type:complete len:638 (-) Transcript_146786:76-1989(-)